MRKPVRPGGFSTQRGQVLIHGASEDVVLKGKDLWKLLGAAAIAAPRDVAEFSILMVIGDRAALRKIRKILKDADRL